MNNNLLSSHGESDFPVIKIGLDYTIMDCNVSALPLLNLWNCQVNNPIPEKVMKQYPEIRDSVKSNDEGGLQVKYNDYVIRFTVVPFPEAGYIGLYGYQVEKSERPVAIYYDKN